MLLDAGLTGLTDDLSPNTVTLKSGHARWTKPATQPLDEGQRRELDQTPIEQHHSKIREMKRDVSPWHELSDSERINFISNWKRKWLWEREMDSLIEEISSSSLPWETPRLIGHRGTGKSHRNGSS